MKKLFFCFALLIATSLYSQEYNSPQIEKRHHFGFGVSSNLFVGSREIDGFQSKLTLALDTEAKLNAHYALSIHSQMNYGIFLEYQYDLNSKSSLAIRLKYSYKCIEYALNIIFDGTVSYLAIHERFKNIELPVIYKHSIYAHNNLKWIYLAGAGADFTVAGAGEGDDVIYPYIRNSSGIRDGGMLKLEHNRTVNPFIILGTAVNCKVNSTHRLEFGLSYNWYFLNDNYQYLYVPGNDIYPQEYNYMSDGFDNNYLAVNISYYF